MSAAVIITPVAQGDIDDAVRWHESRSAGSGGEFLAGFAEVVARIAANPRAYAEDDDGFRRAPFRRLPYIAYYRLKPGGVVDVVAVLQNGRSTWVLKRR